MLKWFFRGQPKEEKEGQQSTRPSPNPKENNDCSSGSEEDNSEDDSDSRDQSGFRCQHCFSASKATVNYLKNINFFYW